MTPPLQERDVVARNRVLLVALSSAVVMGVSLAIVAWLTPPPPAPTSAPAPIAPARARLDALEWVDRDAGIARIPIDRAMDIIAARDGGAP